MLALVLALAPPAHATWSEQGVVIGTLEHPFSYGRATMLHDPGGAYFSWLPYWGCENLLHVDAAQTDTWVSWAFEDIGSTASAEGPAVALDGNGGLFVLEGNPEPVQLRHVLANGTQDWGDPVHGLAVDSAIPFGLDLVTDGSGGVWGAWGFATGQGVRLQHWLADGTVAPGWGPLGRLFPGGWFPALARDGAGGVLLFFGSFSDMRVHVTRVQADTTIAPGWTAAGLDLGEMNMYAMDGFHPLLLPSGDDGWIAIWTRGDEYNSGICRTALARRFLANGTLDPGWVGGAPLAMVTRAGPTGGYGDDSPGLRRFPTTFSDGAGGFHHVWADTATGVPRWLHVTASGGYATGFGWNGIPVLRIGDAIGTDGNFVAASSDDGGIVLAWDDTGAGRSPAVRLRWLMSDGTNDPAAPDTGRVIPGTDAYSHVWGLDAGPAGGVFTLWSKQGTGYQKIFLMNYMERAPYAAVEPPPARATTLALAPPRPTPTRGALDVRCTLPSEVPATLSLYDVSGRRLQDVTLQGAGDHVAHLDVPGDLAPGVYLLRLTQGRESRTARAVLIR